MEDIIHTTHRPPERPPHCLRCGEPLVQAKRGRPRKFCSGVCCSAAWLDGHPPAPHEVPQSCVFCGIPLIQPRVGRPRRFCSITCRSRQYIESIC